MSLVEIMAEAAHKDIHITGGWEGSSPLYKRLEGKVAIVTGGARGIGEATVKLFAKHGAKVMIADIDSVKGNLLAASVPASVTFIHCDVTDESSVSNLISTTLARHGHLDILVNNAGVLGSHSRKSILDFDASEFDRVVQVNVRGAAICMKHAARAMMARGTGSIVSTASVAGVLGGMGPHAYAASKHAVVGLTKNVACELGRYGVRVNSVSPFGVATPMLVGAWCGEEGEEETKMGFEEEEEEVERVEEIVRGMANLKGVTLKAKDVAEAALYLASDESRYVSGHNLVVDGGVTVARNCIGL